MLMQTKVVLGLVGAAAAAVGIGVAVSKGNAPAAPAAPAGTTPVPGVPPQGSQVWVRATTLQPGDEVRVSLPLATLQQIPGVISADLPGFEGLLGAPAVVAALGATNFSAWGPGGPVLPSDWPPDDTGAASEVHAQFVYGTPAGSAGPALGPVLVSQLPIPGLMAWVPKGTGA